MSHTRGMTATYGFCHRARYASFVQDEVPWMRLLQLILSGSTNNTQCTSQGPPVDPGPKGCSDRGFGRPCVDLLEASNSRVGVSRGSGESRTLGLLHWPTQVLSFGSTHQEPLAPYCQALEPWTCPSDQGSAFRIQGLPLGL